MAKGAIRVDWFPVNALAGMKFLTPMEELAYRRIIDLLYTEGGELPDDDTMAEQTRTFKDWKKVRSALEKKGKIIICDGQITNEKCTEVLTEIQHKSDMARLSGKASGATRRKLLPAKPERPLNDRSQFDEEKAPKTATDIELSQVVSKSVDADDSASAPDQVSPDGWPDADKVAQVLAEQAFLRSSPWQAEASEVHKWRYNGMSYDLDVVPTVTSVTARCRRPPRSWSYFTEAVAQSHANRLQALTIPEAENERFDKRQNQPSDGRSTAYLRIAIDRAAKRRGG